MIYCVPRRGRPEPRQKLDHSKCGNGIPRILDPAQHAQQVFDMSSFEELQAAILDEGDTAPSELDLELAAVVPRTEQDRLLLFSAIPSSRCSNTRSIT